LLDMLSTLCDLTGVEIPSTSEGISFKPVLMGEQASIRDVLYGVYCGGTKPGLRCVMQGDWKLIKYDVMDGTVRETQLFNLATNPHEFLQEHGLGGDQVDLAEDDRFAEKRQELEALLLAEMRRLHDPYRLWDQPNNGLQPPQATNTGTRAKQRKGKAKQTAN
jgi:choline-sulfatase